MTKLITTLRAAKQECQRLRLRGQLARLDLLILAELGYVPAKKGGGRAVVRRDRHGL